MQAIDQRAIEEYGIPGCLLMENAGRGVVQALQQKFPDLAHQKIQVVAGKGNNGGDGFVVARHLHNLGADVEITLLGKRADTKNDARLNADIAFKMGIPLKEIQEKNLNATDHRLRHADLVVDALFGTGLTRPATGVYEKMINKINELSRYVVAVDLPSGVESDTGQLIGSHVRAHLTLALALKKRSHLLFPAAGIMGEVRVIDISIPPAAVEAQSIRVQVPEEKDLAAWFPPRAGDAHKGTYGHVLVVAGSRGKGGAAGLTAWGGLRAGCGLVTLALPESCERVLQNQPLEVMTVPLPETDQGVLGPAALDLLLKQAEGKSVIALGPGLSTDPDTRQLLKLFLPEVRCPLVIDADGLNCLAQSKGLLGEIQTEKILTPHPKEMSRISGWSTLEIQENRVELASRFARDQGVILILKGARTIIALPGGSTYINPTGNPGMATGGSGDVLTGILAGFRAQGLNGMQAAIAGTYLHALAGDLYARDQGEISLTASDLLAAFPRAMKTILP